MKSLKLFVATLAVAAITMSSCSDGTGSSGTPLFGSLPGVYEKFQTEQDKLSEEAKNIKSEADKAKLIEKAEKIQEEWSAKIEESAKALDGKTIEFAESDIKINEPLSLEFDGFTSKSDLAPKFKINGSCETASEINTGVVYLGPSEKVYIVGYDADGQQVYKVKVGAVSAENVDGNAVVKAAEPVTFTPVYFSEKEVGEYKAAKTLKLEVLR